jgi:hypothetical protein
VELIVKRIPYWLRPERSYLWLIKPTALLTLMLVLLAHPDAATVMSWLVYLFAVVAWTAERRRAPRTVTSPFARIVRCPMCGREQFGASGIQHCVSCSQKLRVP